MPKFEGTPYTQAFLLILTELHPLSLFQSVLCLQILWYITWPHFTTYAAAFPSRILALLTYRAPFGDDLPVGAEGELTRLCGLWWGEVGTALRVHHGGAVPKALPALELPLLQPGATGHTALWPGTGLPAERNSEGEVHVEAKFDWEITLYHMLISITSNTVCQWLA